jgi:hypothetical protein
MSVQAPERDGQAIVGDTLVLALVAAVSVRLRVPKDDHRERGIGDMTLPRCRDVFGAVPLLCAALFAGCGLGGDDTVDTRQAERGDLPSMPLPQKALGPLGKGLVIDGASGWNPNRKAAEDSLDPDDSGRTLTRAGRLGGYRLSYQAPEPSAPARQAEPYGLTTEVELFRDEVTASTYLGTRLAQLERARGRVRRDGRIVDTGVFDVDDVGDEAEGFALTAVSGNAARFRASIVFRRGRIIASATVVHARNLEFGQEMSRIAGALDDRITRVIAGEIKVAHVRRPKSDRRKNAPHSHGSAETPQRRPASPGSSGRGTAGVGAPEAHGKTGRGAAGAKPRLQLNAADGARARSVLIRGSDLIPAFRPDPRKRTSPAIPRCPGLYMPDRSRVTVTGIADSDYTNGADGIGSNAAFFRSRGDLEAYWRSTVRPAYARCLAQVFDASGAGVRSTILEARSLHIGPVGADRVAAFRTIASKRRGNVSGDVYRTVVFLASGRGMVSMQIVGIDHTCDCSEGLAMKLARRLIVASRD